MTIKSNIVKKEERNINNMQNNLASMIKEKKLFLLDIDGTVALGSELLPGAADFLQTVKENGGIFRFLTNNSSKAASDYVEQFHDWGIETTEEEFITAGTYARDFMKKYYGNEKILVAATETYCSELRKAGLNITDQAGDDVDCVLCAYDTELTYEKLVQVCKQLIQIGVAFHGRIFCNPLCFRHSGNCFLIGLIQRNVERNTSFTERLTDKNIERSG